MLVTIVLSAHQPAPASLNPERTVRRHVLAWSAVCVAAGECTMALLGAAQRHGWRLAFDDLLQFCTRDELREYGSHWRFHWLSTIWLGAIAFLASSTAARLSVPLQPSNSRSLRIAASAFAGPALIFGFSMDTFVDPRFIGHQAREIFTHALISCSASVAELASIFRRPTEFFADLVAHGSGW